MKNAHKIVFGEHHYLGTQEVFRQMTLKCVPDNYVIYVQTR
jgi:hypothetical protein